ncbi:Phosphodiesterase/alkaline phosphatase D [hydrothermal vent metagenome]|uniref:Phosphodiesterase/alkaline phosphatase D n=1 Tax=hydrothermal vent metagenome TaxID=652676 RepID=A0A3B1AI79_9ZZZZ
MKFTRRRFVQSMGAGLALSPLSLSASPDKRKKSKRSPFEHGVASGDPLHDQVILWTRVTPANPMINIIPVQWRMSSDAEFETIVSEGTTHTSAEVDFTVKIDTSDLEPATTYYYQFYAFGHASAIGRTRTLPDEHVGNLRIAFTSCANYPYGFFNVYRMIAERQDLDVVLHLGDYIYEYGNGTYGDGTALDRVPQPDAEIISLSDYRTRYAQYRTDPDLQEAHRQHAFISIWDDHEVANNAWQGGAENHNPELGEGNWLDRRAAAVKAYYEWIPIRRVDPNDPLKAYRSFRFGNLLDLIMLDTRLYGRDQQVPNAQDPALNDPNRKLLGDKQAQWMLDKLDDSQEDEVRWRMLGQQVMFGQLRVQGEIFNLDQWDGYPASRTRVLNHIEQNNINNTIFLTGDIHSSWAMDITDDPYTPGNYNAQSGEGSVAVEFVTPAVTSPALTNEAQADQTAMYLMATNPHMKYVDLFHRGYVLLDITHERTQAEWYHAETITEQGNTNQVYAAAYKVYDAGNRLLIAESPSTAKLDPPEPAPVKTPPQHERDQQEEEQE